MSAFPPGPPVPPALAPTWHQGWVCADGT